MPSAAELLADPQRVADRLGVAVDDASLLAALRQASATFRAAVRHPVSRVDEDTVTLDGDGSTSVLLPAAPVISVSQLCFHGRDITDFDVSTAGMLRCAEPTPDGLGAVQVTYTHGYEPIPEEIAEAVASEAAAAYEAVAGVSSISVGGQQITFRAGMSRQFAQVIELYKLNRGDRV